MKLVDTSPVRECPACALESPAEAETCPFCGYEFPEMPGARRGMAWLFVLLMLLPVLYIISTYIL